MFSFDNIYNRVKKIEEFHEKFSGFTAQMKDFKTILTTLQDKKGSSDARKKFLEYYQRDLFVVKKDKKDNDKKENTKKSYLLGDDLLEGFKPVDFKQSNDFNDLIVSLQSIHALLDSETTKEFVSVGLLAGKKMLLMQAFLQETHLTLHGQELLITEKEKEAIKKSNLLAIPDRKSNSEYLKDLLIAPIQYIARLQLCVKDIIKEMGDIVVYYDTHRDEISQEQLEQLKKAIEVLKSDFLILDPFITEKQKDIERITTISKDALQAERERIKNLRTQLKVEPIRVSKDNNTDIGERVIEFLSALRNKYIYKLYYALMDNNDKNFEKSEKLQTLLQETMGKIGTEIERLNKDTNISDNERKILLIGRIKTILKDLLKNNPIVAEKAGAFRTNIRTNLDSLVTYLERNLSHALQKNDKQAVRSPAVIGKEESELKNSDYPSASLFSPISPLSSSLMDDAELEVEEQKGKDKRKVKKRSVEDTKPFIEKIDSLQLEIQRLTRENELLQDEKKAAGNDLTIVRDNKISPLKCALVGAVILAGIAGMVLSAGTAAVAYGVFYCAFLASIHLLAQVSLFAGGAALVTAGAYKLNQYRQKSNSQNSALVRLSLFGKKPAEQDDKEISREITPPSSTQTAV